jgi:hypothetical protein
VLVGDGTKLWIHDPDLNQVTVKRIDQAISSTPAALLAGRTTSRRSSPSRTQDCRRARVGRAPRAQDTGFERVRLGCAGTSPRWSFTRWGPHDAPLPGLKANARSPRRSYSRPRRRRDRGRAPRPRALTCSRPPLGRARGGIPRLRRGLAWAGSSVSS